jgi:hypothetical protein
MAKISLPPLVKEIANGTVIWKSIEGLDCDTLGYFLFYHLVIEHYLDRYLDLSYPTLDWDVARLTFNQKVLLLSRLKFPDSRFDFISAIKHMNSVRNKLSHDISFRIGLDDLLPITQFLAKATGRTGELPSGQMEILQVFTLIVCAYLGGTITFISNDKKGREPSGKGG